jgi:hypothetical protein
MFLQQLHYWLKKPAAHVREGFDGISRRWIYNTYEEWHRQFPFWSAEVIRKIVSQLESKGLILTERHNKRRGDQTKWYAIDYEVLNKLFEDEAENLPPAPTQPEKIRNVTRE